MAEVDVTALQTKVEWALKIDCTLQGCDPPHEDDGEVRPFMGRPGVTTINGHAARRVKRVVTYGTWTEA